MNTTPKKGVNPWTIIGWMIVVPIVLYVGLKFMDSFMVGYRSFNNSGVTVSAPWVG